MASLGGGLEVAAVEVESVEGGQGVAGSAVGVERREAAQVAKEDHKEVKPAEKAWVAASCRSAEAPQFLRPPPSESPHQ